METKKVTLGIFLIVISYIIVFVPKTFEVLHDYISYSEVVGFGYVFIGVGIMGFMILLNGIMN